MDRVRKMTVAGPDGPLEVKVPFYKGSRKSHIKIVAASIGAVVKFFQNAYDSATEIFKSYGQDRFFGSENGNLLMLFLELQGPAYAVPAFGTAAVKTAYNKLRSVGRIIIKIGGDLVHEEGLSALLPPVDVTDTLAEGPVNPWQPGKPLCISFEDGPLPIDAENVEVILEVPSTFVWTDLDTYILAAEWKCIVNRVKKSSAVAG